ncbi:MAG: leucine-rich repeat domain-containing protein [Candidatus Helarchaeota archaeon]|nr:leucine-rich repeat domain-containing protein [Candidatus Helarchaeota archaeon]
MTNIKIKDKWLLYALKNEVGKTLTKKNLANITYLDWSEYRDEAGETWSPIGDIQGLEYCTNLEVLSFDGNSVSDLSPLSGLKKLKEIWLVDNAVEDVSPISKLPNLEKLVLDLNSHLIDISPLSSLPSIKYINISNTSVRDITPLQNLNTLEKLGLYIDKLDISPGSKNRDVLIKLINKGVQVKNSRLEELIKEIKLKKKKKIKKKKKE